MSSTTAARTPAADICDVGNYAVIGDCKTAALVSAKGSIDWLCWPRFDSDACLAALLGGKRFGSWTMTPGDSLLRCERRYLPDTLILETRMSTAEGTVRLVDFMPFGDGTSDIVRIVIGESGKARMRSSLDLRFDYGRAPPWVVRLDERLLEAIAGPHAVVVQAGTNLSIENGQIIADFVIEAGQRAAFVARYHPSCSRRPVRLEAERALASTERAWRGWSSHCTYCGPWKDAVVRSLITMKALTYQLTGASVAAVTTSLTEAPDVPRTWDYRFCWLRDASFALPAFMGAGYREEAVAWREWLLRAVAGAPDQVQPVYGVAGEPRLPEWKVPWLPGRSGQYMVHVGNAASGQRQLDVYGEILDALHETRDHAIGSIEAGCQLERALIEQVERIWREPDRGIWESRGAPEHYTHSKVMAWVALDRGIRTAELSQPSWPLERWRHVRDTIHADVCQFGFDAELGAFVHSYQTRILDASTLLIPVVGFLPPGDPRVIGTVRAIERDLASGVFVRRYDSSKVQGQAREGAFLACSFWLIDNLLMQGAYDRAADMFERLLAVRNDVGLLAEEYDPDQRVFRGNFPQTLSHLALVNTAFKLRQAQERGRAGRCPRALRNAHQASAS